MNNSKVKSTVEKAGNDVLKVVSKSKDIVIDSKDKVFDALDVNKDGKIDTEDIIIIGLKTPGVHIDRTSFLEKQFMKISKQSNPGCD